MTKIVSYNVFATITAVKDRENPCKVSKAARKTVCEANAAVSYQEH